MSRTPRSTKVTVDEQKLADLVKTKSDLSIKGQKKVWEKIAEQLSAPVDSVKKAYLKIQEEDPKLKMLELNKRKSLRSSNIDSVLNDQQKTMELRRRSLRSSSIDKSSLITPSNENSCASSTCSSPKGEDKRSLRSRSQLSSITELELISMAAGDAAIMEHQELKDQIQDSTADQDPDQDLDENTLVFDMSNQESNFSEIISEVVERELEKTLPPRYSDPGENSKKVSQFQPNYSFSPKARPILNKNKIKRNFPICDSTRTFFDSMALTVASFPPHLQAQVKIQICKIVGEIEYDLSLPKTR